MIKIIVLDIDGTLWDHLDASSLVEPLKLIDYNIKNYFQYLSIEPHPYKYKILF